MADIDAEVMEFVEKTLAAQPDIPAGELYSAAQQVAPSVGELDRRQFNARYVLQVKRRRAAAAGGVAARGARRPRATSDGEVRKSRGVRGSKARTAPLNGAAKAPVRRRSRKGAGAEARDGVRQVLLSFASALVSAEERKELVAVLAGVDGYVDRALEAAGVR